MPNTIDLLGLLKVVVVNEHAGVVRPNPTALDSLVEPDDVEQRRSLSCSEYDQCLDAAYRRDWKSWTCERCNIFLLGSALRGTRNSRSAQPSSA